MRIALVEWTQGGHHEVYIKTAASGFAAAGHEVWLIHPHPEEIRAEILAIQPELTEQIKNCILEPHGALVRTSDPRLRNVGKWLSLRRALRSIQPETKFDLVFFMFLDDFLVPLVSTKWLDSAFPYPWAGIYMQPLFRLQEAKLGRRREFLRRDHLFRSRRFKGAMVLDEAAAPWLTDRFRRPFVPLPEPGDMGSPDIDSPIVRELLTFAAGRPIVGVFGSLAKRKGLLTVLRVAAENSGVEFVLAIAGKLEVATYTPEELSEIAAATAALGERCWYRPEPIPSDSAFFGLMSVSSVAYLAYEDWVNSSGLQSMAARFNVPSVVADNGIMAERAHEFQTGITIDPASHDAAAAAIQRLLTEKLPEEGFARYAAQHSTRSFQADLCKFVELPS